MAPNIITMVHRCIKEYNDKDVILYRSTSNNIL